MYIFTHILHVIEGRTDKTFNLDKQKSGMSDSGYEVLITKFPNYCGGGGGGGNTITKTFLEFS